MEQPIIQPISKELLKSELTPDKQLRMTNKSNNEIYIITAHDAPNVMREIGRLREIAFREAGGGTGKEVDIDEFDTCENCYKQLIVWNPEAEEIIKQLRFHFNCKYDEKDSIGKRYRRQDAVGTPYCITVDHDTLTDGTVTLRNRDTMAQERVKIDDLVGIIEDKVSITSLLKKLVD